MSESEWLCSLVHGAEIWKRVNSIKLLSLWVVFKLMLLWSIQMHMFRLKFLCLKSPFVFGNEYVSIHTHSFIHSTQSWIILPGTKLNTCLYHYFSQTSREQRFLRFLTWSSTIGNSKRSNTHGGNLHLWLFIIWKLRHIFPKVTPSLWFPLPFHSCWH